MKQYKIVYCTPALYMAGGVERVLSLKASYFADHFGYDVTIVLTDGKDKPPFYPLSPKVKVVNLDIGFERLWTLSFWQKIPVYLVKQWRYRKRLTALLNGMHADITVSLLRREINFLHKITDGSQKVGELHINRAHYRNFEGNDVGLVKKLFARLWMKSLVGKLRELNTLVVLTPYDRDAWTELRHVKVIPNPLTFWPQETSTLSSKRIIVLGRYCHEKGYDHLLQAWQRVEQARPDWRLDIFGDGDRQPYEQMARQMGISTERCQMHGATTDVAKELTASAVCVCSSRFEGFGMAIIEAMACGVPVVSFDCPWGPRSIIAHNEDGLLVENGNAEALATALTELTGDTERLLRMGRQARENVKRYSLDAVAEQWRQLFDNVI